MALSDEIKRLRLAAGFKSQKALADAVGVSQPFIHKLESGEKDSFSEDVLKKMAVALAVPAKKLAALLPKQAAARKASGTEIPDMGIVWGSPPRDVPDPVPGNVYHLVGRFPADTFALKVSGDSVHEYGIHDGDVIAVRPTTEPEEGALIVARQGNAYTIKAYIDGEMLSFAKGESIPKKLAVSEPMEMVGVMIGVIDGERRAVPRPKLRAKGKKG